MRSATSAPKGMPAVSPPATLSKASNPALRITVTVRPRGETQTLVRANASYELEAIEEPGPYQDFFAALEKAMFLQAHAVD